MSANKYLIAVAHINQSQQEHAEKRPTDKDHESESNKTYRGSDPNAPLSTVNMNTKFKDRLCEKPGKTQKLFTALQHHFSFFPPVKYK